MSEQLSPAERYDLATQLITQSPPGQVNDVIAAIQIIVDDNSDEFKQQVLLRLREYHRAQLQSVTLTGAASPTLISEASTVSSDTDRYVDPQSKRSFKLDHFTLETSDEQPHEIKPDFETFRSELQTALSSYLGNHYSTSDSVGTVFSTAKPIAQKAVKAEKKTEDVVRPAETARTEETIAVPVAEESIEGEKPVDMATTGLSDTVDKAAVSGDEPEVDKTVDPAESVSAPNDPAVESTGETSSEPAEPSSTGIIAAAETAMAETVESVKEVLSADVPVAAVGTREAGEIAGEVPAEQDVVKEDKTASLEVNEAHEEEEDLQKDPVYTVCIVGNKYNTNNFWTGRWRSVWTVNVKEEKLHGEVHVDVHYFEAGNVQLSTSQSFDLPLPPADADRASKILNGIAKLEAEYQLKLSETNQQFGDKEFRSLRRALPITRTRIDWDKVSAYRLRSKA